MNIDHEFPVFGKEVHVRVNGYFTASYEKFSFPTDDGYMYFVKHLDNTSGIPQDNIRTYFRNISPSGKANFQAILRSTNVVKRMKVKDKGGCTQAAWAWLVKNYIFLSKSRNGFRTFVLRQGGRRKRTPEILRGGDVDFFCGRRKRKVWQYSFSQRVLEKLLHWRHLRISTYIMKILHCMMIAAASPSIPLSSLTMQGTKSRVPITCNSHKDCPVGSSCYKLFGNSGFCVVSVPFQLETF